MQKRFSNKIILAIAIFYTFNIRTEGSPFWGALLSVVTGGYGIVQSVLSFLDFAPESDNPVSTSKKMNDNTANQAQQLSQMTVDEKIDISQAILNDSNIQQINVSPTFNVGFSIFGLSNFSNNNAKKRPKELLNKINKWISNNPAKFVIYILGLAYILINYRLFKLSNKLKRKNCWSLWQYELPNHILYLTPKKSLSFNLFEEIQNRYTNFNNLKRTKTPFASFLEAIEAEQANLKSYVTLINFVKKFGLFNLLLSCDLRLYKQAKDRYKRLTFIKNTFSAWYNENQLEEKKAKSLIK